MSNFTGGTLALEAITWLDSKLMYPVGDAVTTAPGPQSTVIIDETRVLASAVLKIQTPKSLGAL